MKNPSLKHIFAMIALSIVFASPGLAGKGRKVDSEAREGARVGQREPTGSCEDSQEAAVEKCVVSCFKTALHQTPPERDLLKTHPSVQGFCQELDRLRPPMTKKGGRLSARDRLEEKGQRATLFVKEFMEGNLGGALSPRVLALCLKEGIQYLPDDSEACTDLGKKLINGTLGKERLSPEDLIGVAKVLLTPHSKKSLSAVRCLFDFLGSREKYEDAYELCKAIERSIAETSPDVRTYSYYGMGRLLRCGLVEQDLTPVDRFVKAMGCFDRGDQKHRASSMWKDAEKDIEKIGAFFFEKEDYAQAMHAFRLVKTPTSLYWQGQIWEKNPQVSPEERYEKAKEMYEQADTPEALRALAKLKRPETLHPISSGDRLRTLFELYQRIYAHTQDSKEWKDFAFQVMCAEKLHTAPENFQAIRQYFENHSFPWKQYYLGSLWYESTLPETDRARCVSQAAHHWRKGVEEENDGMAANNLAGLILKKELESECPEKEAAELLKRHIHNPDPLIANRVRERLGLLYVGSHIPDLFSTPEEQKKEARALCKDLISPWGRTILGVSYIPSTGNLARAEKLEALEHAAQHLRVAALHGYTPSQKIEFLRKLKT